jgi:hypothetical protein
MNQRLAHAFISGYEGLTAWSDLLDRINVFPVADADTGTNLRLSLAPLRLLLSDRQGVLARLPYAATGNSGNIAACFFQEFLQAETTADLSAAAARGRERARSAVLDPQAGTMLTIFDCLAQALAEAPESGHEPAWLAIGQTLLAATASTTSALPVLQQAGVVDAGALAMFIFFDLFLQTLAGRTEPSCAVTELFPGRLLIDRAYSRTPIDAHCVDALIELDTPAHQDLARFAALGDSVVVQRDRSRLKLHLHTHDPEEVRERLTALGRIVRWADTDMAAEVSGLAVANQGQGAIRIMTDAAGSISRALAARHGIILLDSYIAIGDDSRPETLLDPREVYASMRRGEKVSTAQASLSERHQRYAGTLGEYGQVLYLCVGAAFTGNYAAVLAWKKEHDPGDRLLVLDSEAASGRLGALAIACARFAATAKDIGLVARFAGQAIQLSEEYIFIDQLKYLVAGGRLSRSGGFMGDLLGMKPVVTPTRDGAKRVGVVRSLSGQLEFAVQRLREKVAANGEALILLQYTDNLDWVRDVAGQELRALFPRAEIMVQPISLTSGVHIGPGSWAMAFMPQGGRRP